MFKGLEFFHFLRYHPHFDGIATHTRKAIVQHRIATKIEGRIAPLGCQFVAFSAGIVLRKRHVVCRCECHRLRRITVVGKCIGLEFERIFCITLKRECMVPNLHGFCQSVVEGMLSPHLPLVDAVLDIDIAMRQSHLGYFVEK